MDNRDELLSQMDLFLGKFTELREALRCGDGESMKAMMRLSTSRRALFDRQKEIEEGD